MSADQAIPSELAPRPGLDGHEHEADHMLRQVLGHLDRVDEEHKRFLSEARSKISELYFEAVVTKATADKTARQILSDAHAEASAMLRAAREECAGVRNEMARTLEKRIRVILEDARKASDELLEAATAEAERLRSEAATAKESVLSAARAEGTKLVEDALRAASRIRSEAEAVAQPGLHSEYATRARTSSLTSRPGSGHESDPVLRQPGCNGHGTAAGDGARPTPDQMGQAFERLSGAIDAMASGAPEAEPPRQEPGQPDPASEPVDASLPLMGSRGQQAPTAPVSAEGADTEAPLRPFERRPNRSPYVGSHPSECSVAGTADARRIWRFRNN